MLCLNSHLRQLPALTAQKNNNFFNWPDVNKQLLLSVILPLKWMQEEIFLSCEHKLCRIKEQHRVIKVLPDPG